jgi:hypothetical protein
MRFSSPDREQRDAADEPKREAAGSQISSKARIDPAVGDSFRPWPCREYGDACGPNERPVAVGVDQAEPATSAGGVIPTPTTTVQGRTRHERTNPFRT